MTDKIQKARDLYFCSGKTQKEIALEIGVTERTIYNWIKQNNWQQLREESYHMPALIADNLCRQVVALQNSIEARDAEKRFPTMHEAEITRKLITCMDKMKRYPTVALYKQMFQTFRDYIRPQDSEFTSNFCSYTERFLEGRMQNGFHPYDMEYTATPTAPIEDITAIQNARMEPTPEGPANSSDTRVEVIAAVSENNQLNDAELIEYQQLKTNIPTFPVPEKTGNPRRHYLLPNPIQLTQAAPNETAVPNLGQTPPAPSSRQPQNTPSATPPINRNPSPAQLKELTAFLKRTA